MGSSTATVIGMCIFCLLASYFFLRWTFSINKQTRQNDAIIQLLTIIAKNNGMTDDEGGEIYDRLNKSSVL